MSWKGLLAAGVLSGAAAVSTVHAVAVPHGPEDDREALFAFFAHLEGGEWWGEGEWAGGGRFEQVHRYERSLDGRLVRLLTLMPDSAGSGLVLRAEGVRAWDEEAGAMRFWEFDRYGGITEGRVGLHGEALYYEYPYTVGGATQTLRDEWRPTVGGGYEYRVGAWGDGAWEQTFLVATFRRRDPPEAR